MDIYAKAAELTAQGRAFAVATVVRVEGSSSARRGSKAIIMPREGSCWGGSAAGVPKAPSGVKPCAPLNWASRLLSPSI